MSKSEGFARFVIFSLYVWFGLIKIWGTSAASPLIVNLLSKIAHIIPPDNFLLFLGGFEIIVGLLFLIPLWTRAAKTLFAIHMVIVFLPLLLLPGMIWQSLFIPTVEGQYIIKNFILIALVAGL